MNYHIEVDGQMADELVCSIIRDHRSYMLDDLNEIRSGKPRHIFSTDQYEDIAEIQAHISAFTKVLTYFGK